MIYKISLQKNRAELVVKEMNNGTRIVPDSTDYEGWVVVEVHLEHSYDALKLYHAGMEAKTHQLNEWKQIMEQEGY